MSDSLKFNTKTHWKSRLSWLSWITLQSLQKYTMSSIIITIISVHLPTFIPGGPCSPGTPFRPGVPGSPLGPGGPLSPYNSHINAWFKNNSSELITSFPGSPFCPFIPDTPSLPSIPLTKNEQICITAACLQHQHYGKSYSIYWGSRWTRFSGRPLKFRMKTLIAMQAVFTILVVSASHRFAIIIIFVR